MTGDAPVVVNLRADGHDLYIGRGSKWGNPFRIGPLFTREECVEEYRAYLAAPGQAWLRACLGELTGKRLGCYCKPQACHGDVLVEFWRAA